MTHEEAIKFCDGYLPECDTKKFVIKALERQKDIPKAIDDIEEVVYAECYEQEYQIIMRYIRERLGEDND